MVDATHQTLEALISKMKSDTTCYARRKIILPKQHDLIGLGQLNFILSPIQYEDDHYHLNMLLPRQLMTVSLKNKRRKKLT